MATLQDALDIVTAVKASQDAALAAQVQLDLDLTKIADLIASLKGGEVVTQDQLDDLVSKMGDLKSGSQAISDALAAEVAQADGDVA